MTDDKKPKDLSNISTNDLIKEFAEIEAKLNTALNKEAAKQLKFPPADEDDLKETEIGRIQNTLSKQAQLRAGKGDKEYREMLEKSYRTVETITNDPKEFQKKVDILKKRFGVEKGANATTPLPTFAVLWDGDVSDTLSNPSMPRKPSGMKI